MNLHPINFGKQQSKPSFTLFDFLRLISAWTHRGNYKDTKADILCWVAQILSSKTEAQHLRWCEIRQLISIATYPINNCCDFFCWCFGKMKHAGVLLALDCAQVTFNRETWIHVDVAPSHSKYTTIGKQALYNTAVSGLPANFCRQANTRRSLTHKHVMTV